jgi:arylformamidase
VKGPTALSTIFLSYPLNAQSPAYGDGGRISLEAIQSIQRGDSCNTSLWTIPNHLGTHIDAPRHFDSNGLTIDQFPANHWIYCNIGFVDVTPIEPGALITANQVLDTTLPADIGILLIKTNFALCRGKKVYWQQNPGLSPEAAEALRHHFPSLRIIGLDSISISSYSHREVGRKTHKLLLNHPQPILIIEDMDLSKVFKETIFKRITIAPVIVTGADGAPCTVLAEVV